MEFGSRFWVVAALSLGPAVANSFARFAYALLLPAMRAELSLNYSQAGSLNTANALGYLAGALLTMGYVSRLGNRRLFCVGMVVTVLALVGSGLAGGFIAQLCLRAVAGIGGAMVFVSGAVLASNVYSNRPELSSSAIAVYFGGAGAGILLSGVGIPWLLAIAGDDAWRTAWLAIGGVSAAFAVLGIWAARQIREPSSGAAKSPWQMRTFQATLGSYFLFGVGYIAYMTFVVAWMVSHGASALDVALTWGTLGIATMLAPIGWRLPRARWYPAKVLAAVGVILSVGAAMPLVSTSLPAMILSALFFGAAMFTAPTAVTDLVKTSLPRTAWGPAVATFTVVFAIGQAIGPVLSGWLADATQSLYAGLAGSVAILLTASAAAMCQRESKDRPNHNPAFKEIQMEKRNVNVLLHLARPSVGNDIRSLIHDLTRLAGVAHVAPGSRVSNLLRIDYDPARISMRTLLARARRGWSLVRGIGTQGREAISRHAHAVKSLGGSAVLPPKPQ
jgi:predicted MFS family arabinose efflux permease